MYILIFDKWEIYLWFCFVNWETLGQKTWKLQKASECEETRVWKSIQSWDSTKQIPVYTWWQISLKTTRMQTMKQLLGDICNCCSRSFIRKLLCIYLRTGVVSTSSLPYEVIYAWRWLKTSELWTGWRSSPSWHARNGQEGWIFYHNHREMCPAISQRGHAGFRHFACAQQCWKEPYCPLPPPPPPPGPDSGNYTLEYPDPCPVALILTRNISFHKMYM